MKLIQPNIFLYFFLIILAAGGFVFPVLWPNSIGFYAFIVMMSLGGFGVASYIFYTKKKGKQLVCPVGSDCNAVINSQYSRFLGVPLEYGGMAYYGIIFVSYLCLIFAPHFFSETMILILLLLTTAAFLFSLYLLFVQAFILRQWCIWCMLSAALSIVTFIIALTGASYAVTFLSKVTEIVEFVRILGFALGIGAVSISLHFFFQFLRDSKIDNKELQILKGISEIVLLGLVFVLITQFLDFIVNPKVLSESATFLVQMIALFVAGLSGAALMIIFSPMLAMIPFNKSQSSQNHPSFKVLKKPFFATSAIATSSWYFAFVIEYLFRLDFLNLLFTYVVVLLLAVSLSLVWEKKIEE